MASHQESLLETIGGTSLLALRRVGADTGARVLLKLESENPTGSMKDRMALAMIEAAEVDGRLAEGSSVVEYTGGSTGVSLALVCAVKGYPIRIVTSDAFAREKLDHMELLGADLKVIESDGGKMTEGLTRAMIAEAGEIAERYGAFWSDQLNNADQLEAYGTLADEIWEQTEGRVDAFVQSVGTAGSIRGVGDGLRARNPRVQIVAVEPAESAVLSGGPTGAHKIDGVGAGFVVPLWHDAVADRIERVSTIDAVGMAMRLAQEEGLFAGTSTGANVLAALRLADELGPDSTVVTLMCDTGMKYLSSPAYLAHTSRPVE